MLPASNRKFPDALQAAQYIVFDRLSGSAKASDHQGQARGQQETYNRSILDHTRESLNRINGSLGVNDRLRVDEFLTSIREIERRLGR